MEPIDGYDRAEIAGITFTRAMHHQAAQAKTCTVMVKAGQGCVAIGQVRLFSRWLPPWASMSRDWVDWVADVQWYGMPRVKMSSCAMLRRSPEHFRVMWAVISAWLRRVSLAMLPWCQIFGVMIGDHVLD